MENCVFCKIISGEIPAYILYEDENVMAILDAFPAQEGHTLIIPKTHHVNLLDLPAELAPEIMLASHKLIRALSKALETDDFTVLQNNGHLSGQEVMHYHMHLVPRYPGRGDRGNAQALHPKGYEYKPTKDELKQIAEKIKAKL